MGKQINEREIVLEILMEITENGAYSHKILGDVLSKYQYLEKRERAFITRVVEGTLEHMIEIDYILNQISKTKVKKMKPVIRNLLRSSVYQLKYMDSVPDHAVCSEAVKLAVRKGFSGLRGYVNGVLRNVVRKMDEIEYPKEDVQRLSVKYSVPEWILSLWKKEYGEEITEKMAADFQKEKPITIRCCMNRVTPEVLKEKKYRDNMDSIILIDDFIGSGETALECLTYLDFLKQEEKKLYVLALVAQKQGIENIRKEGISVFVNVVREKGITDKFDKEEAQQKLDEMEKISKLLQVSKKMLLGYLESESLVAMNKTPNNTFPVYWHEGKGHSHAPFPRKENVKVIRMEKEKNEGTN